jgi:hypothetical protein
MMSCLRSADAKSSIAPTKAKFALGACQSPAADVDHHGPSLGWPALPLRSVPSSQSFAIAPWLSLHWRGRRFRAIRHSELELNF